MSEELFHNVNLGWNQITLSRNELFLIIVLIGIFLHSLLWFQLLIYKIRIDLTFFFSLTYLLTDFMIMLAFIIQYIIRTNFQRSTHGFVCYFEAYFIVYIDIIETICLTFISICRYYEIVLNKNIYINYRKLILFISIILAILIIINMFIQNYFSWSIVLDEIGSSCSINNKNIYVIIFNEIIFFFIPIILCFYLNIQCLIYLKKRNCSKMNNNNYKLINRFLIFYIIWLILWGPFVFIEQFYTKFITNQIEFIVILLTTLDNTIDAILVSHLDQRFKIVWKKTYSLIKTKLKFKRTLKIHSII
ncbi:unnamed protein product [Adineta steineri]|uniref:G-protein coupled receptors family 1 profile domain-containing protein n=1 Tax=Adineta steineri TaxID=433720 RepID=A0A814JZJ1_9BILA|nr:unnamed protein product [Adineta steineri]CAF1120588.1 unnamed protein product [Adineta steineri]